MAAKTVITGGPWRQIAATAWMVGMGTGFVIAFHLLGLLNIVSGRHMITPAAVVLASALGIGLPIILLRRMRLRYWPRDAPGTRLCRDQSG